MRNKLYIWVAMMSVYFGYRLNDDIAVQQGDRYICMMKVCSR